MRIIRGILVLTLSFLLIVGSALAVCSPPFTSDKADLNGDGTVNLIDVSMFSADYHSPVYQVRSDFNCSGAPDVGDVALMAQAYGW